MQRYVFENVAISRTNLRDALADVSDRFQRDEFGYVCFMDTRTAYLANRDEEYRSIQESSLMTFPDGMPLVWAARMQGLSDVGKVSGKDFMDAVFSVSEENGYTHYFYGSTPETVEKIRENLGRKYPGLVILGAVSPPFQPLEDFDVDGLAEELNRLGPVFFWCGLGAPKQEYLISRLQPKLERTCCAGVGLAFEYLAGTVARAPGWMQRSGLEWVFRLFQQPGNIRRVALPFLWVLKALLFSVARKKNAVTRR